MPFRGTDKASSSARGYGISHQRERARWKLIVDAGNAYCAQPVCVMAARWIAPGSQWCLGHTADRTAYLGPVHRACNEMDGARRGSRIRTREASSTTPRSSCATCAGSRRRASRRAAASASDRTRPLPERRRVGGAYATETDICKTLPVCRISPAESFNRRRYGA